MHNVEVFWAPVYPPSEIDWNIMYKEPTSLYDQKRPKMTESPRNDNFFYCPAFKNFAKNTFVFENPITSHFIINGRNIESKEKNYIDSQVIRDPSITNSIQLEYGLTFIFFSTADINISVTSPYFNNPNHLKYANLVPGRFNINKWFRAINMEFCLNENSNEFKIDKGEDVCYISFDTDAPVKLQRFVMNDQLQSLARSCGSSSSWESWVPLASRYKRFLQSRTNEFVLREIKKQLL